MTFVDLVFLLETVFKVYEYEFPSIGNECDHVKASIKNVNNSLNKILNSEIIKKELFMELAPTADDLWFWVMEKRQNITVELIPNARYGLNTAVNRIDVWEPNKEVSLYFINEINVKNDKQFHDLVEHYNIKP